MKFDVQVGLGRGHIVLDGDPGPPKKRRRSPQFRPISIMPYRVHGLLWLVPQPMSRYPVCLSVGLCVHCRLCVCLPCRLCLSPAGRRDTTCRLDDSSPVYGASSTSWSENVRVATDMRKPQNLFERQSKTCALSSVGCFLRTRADAFSSFDKLKLLVIVRRGACSLPALCT